MRPSATHAAATPECCAVCACPYRRASTMSRGTTMLNTGRCFHLIAVLFAPMLAGCDSKGSTTSPTATSALPTQAAPMPERPRTPVVLARMSGDPKHVAVDTSAVYVTVEDWSKDDLPTDIVRIPLEGGEPTV